MKKPMMDAELLTAYVNHQLWEHDEFSLRPMPDKERARGDDLRKEILVRMAGRERMNAALEMVRDANREEPHIPPVALATIESAMSENGGWTKEQLAEWGVPWPPPKGWRKDLEDRIRQQQNLAQDSPYAHEHGTPARKT
jgi:hypothetical protein